MASAILAGLVKAHPTLERHVIEPFAETREKIAATGARVYVAPTREAVESADAVVLATKPQTLRDACAQLAAHLNDELIVSIAAGWDHSLAVKSDGTLLSWAVTNSDSLAMAAATSIGSRRHPCLESRG
ncbi:MAG: NAD(P)-binding domain-containing protein [Pleurocapsa sp. SU_196_0]|nr:NAD(P)-binding domain-containing protein [Pleurocapsa sp. SU_196_0]